MILYSVEARVNSTQGSVYTFEILNGFNFTGNFVKNSKKNISDQKPVVHFF